MKKFISLPIETKVDICINILIVLSMTLVAVAITIFFLL